MEFIPDSLKLAGKLGANNLDPDTGYPKDWTGGIHAQEIYAEGKIGLGSKGELKISLNKDGDAFLAGKLGIGTTSPTAKLHIYSNDNDALKITNTALSKAARMGIDSLGVWIEPSETNSGIRLNANPSLVGLYISGTDGNVGIGTANPQSKLHIDTSGGLNPLIISGYANNKLAQQKLDSLPNGTLIIGGPSGNSLHFYWKDQNGDKFMSMLDGKPFPPK